MKISLLYIHYHIYLMKASEERPPGTHLHSGIGHLVSVDLADWTYKHRNPKGKWSVIGVPGCALVVRFSSQQQHHPWP